MTNLLIGSCHWPFTCKWN